MNHMEPVKKTLPEERVVELFSTLEKRFKKHRDRHADMDWPDVEKRIRQHADKLWSLNELEETGGEPDVVAFDRDTGAYTFYDCSPESPKGRRSLCYDEHALMSRKEHKPRHSALGLAAEMGVDLLTEEDYFYLQTVGKFDNKTSSWIRTAPEIRKLGGAIFGDLRFGRVFIYHNGAESYYGARAFRAKLEI